MRLRSPFRNYSVEAFYSDVPDCVGMKTFRKTHEIHSFSMIFSSDAFYCLKSYFHKRSIITTKVISSYSCFGFMFHDLVYHDTPRIWWTHISNCGLLSVSCPIAQGTFLWYSSIFANITHPEMQPWPIRELVCTGTDSLNIHPLRAWSVSKAPVKATELESVGFIPVISWLHPTRIPKNSWLHHPWFSRANISAALAN